VVLNESIALMVMHANMHLMEITYVNVGFDVRPCESFWANDSLEHS